MRESLIDQQFCVYRNSQIMCASLIDQQVIAGGNECANLTAQGDINNWFPWCSNIYDREVLVGLEFSC